MRTIFVLLISLLIFWGCTSDSTEEYLENEIEEGKSEFNPTYEKFKNEGNAEFQDFSKKIQRFKELTNSEKDLTPFNSEDDSILMNFNAKKNVLLISINDIDEVGSQIPVFENERTILDLQKVMSEPVDSFLQSFYNNSKYRIEEFQRLVKYSQEQMIDYEYIIVLKTFKNVMPIVNDKKSYEMGLFEGKLFIYKVDSEELLHIIDVIAINSESITANSKDTKNVILNDYKKQIGKAVYNCLLENCNTEELYAISVNLTEKY